MARMANKKTLEEHERTRAARFTLNPSDTDEWVEERKNHGLVDELMGEVPGKDNYGAELIDDAFVTPTYPPGSSDTSSPAQLKTSPTTIGGCGLIRRIRSYTEATPTKTHLWR